ncbi:MAG: radical SAM protein, partial [Candidatus Woesearchaeota archaeon]
MMDKIKTRTFEESNYHAVNFNGKTLRFAIDPLKEISELKYPEFYDIKITDKCSGNCSYCYQDSKKTSKHYKDIVKKTHNFFAKMSTNERPFQVALGGGNPNEHPDFIKLLRELKNLGIMPNYTTNGMGLTEDILRATKHYCGGVAVSCHEHLENTWRSAVRELYDYGIKTNLH